jgi:hypothetical protein
MFREERHEKYSMVVETTMEDEVSHENNNLYVVGNREQNPNLGNAPIREQA